MGSGASRYTSVEEAVAEGVPHADIDKYLCEGMEPELEAMNRCFSTPEGDLPHSAPACGRAAQKTLESLGFNLKDVVFCNCTGREELAREHGWWSARPGGFLSFDGRVSPPRRRRGRPADRRPRDDATRIHVAASPRIVPADYSR